MSVSAAPSEPVIRALVLCGYGINCEEESAAALRLAGASVVVAHVAELLSGAIALEGYDVLVLPGGFSFGDELGSGKVLANLLRFRRGAAGEPLLPAMQRHLHRGRLIVGVCNGFQALVRLGLLPNVAGRGEQEVTLAANDSGRFEDRWVECVVDPRTRTRAFDGLARFRLPIRHGEGKLVVRNESVRRAIVEQGLCCLRYADAEGRPAAEYPANPNGSALACAALTDPSGRVLGMMPHPEAFLSRYNDPSWPARRRGSPSAPSDDGDGLQVFRNIVRACERAARGAVNELRATPTERGTIGEVRATPTERGTNGEVRATPTERSALGGRRRRIAILISGRGSNMEAIVRAARHGPLADCCEVVLVFANRPDAPGLERAARLGCATACLSSRSVDRNDFDAALLELLEPRALDWLVLAGYSRILSPAVVRRYRGHIVNIHPADSRQYRGLHGYRWAFEQRLHRTWVTVHLVDEGVDTGPVLAQAPVDLTGASSVAEVEERGLPVEHALYVATLARLWRGELHLGRASASSELMSR